MSCWIGLFPASDCASFSVPRTSWQLEHFTPPVDYALNEVIALHATLVRRAVGEVCKSLNQLVFFEHPEILTPLAHVVADRSIVVFAFDRITQRAPLRVALDADVVGGQ
jgi:hypothetical protein